MISSLFKFLDANHSKVFWGYIIFILLVVVLPLNGGLAVAAEGVQYFLPYRAFNVNDMISNVIGMMLGLGVMGRLRDGGTKRLRD